MIKQGLYFVTGAKLMIFLETVTKKGNVTNDE